MTDQPNTPNVFAELLTTSNQFIETLTNVESEQSQALTLYMNLMQSVLKVYEDKIHGHAKSAQGASAKHVQYHTAMMSMYSGQADNMKTVFSSNEQSLTQAVSKEGTDMSNYVQQAEGGMDVLQTTNSLLQSAYA